MVARACTVSPVPIHPGLACLVTILAMTRVADHLLAVRCKPTVGSLADILATPRRAHSRTFLPAIQGNRVQAAACPAIPSPADR